MLKAAGFTVFEAGTAQEGLELMRKVHPHLALLDVKPPAMNGIDLARIIKSDPIRAHAGAANLGDLRRWQRPRPRA